MKKKFLFIVAAATLLVGCGNPTPASSLNPESSSQGTTESNITITVDKENVNIVEGATEKVVATVTGAMNKNVNWNSDNEEIATVSGGTITGVKAGSCKVIATAVADSTKKVEINVIVSENPDKPTKMTIANIAENNPIPEGTADKTTLTSEKTFISEGMVIAYGKGSALVYDGTGVILAYGNDAKKAAQIGECVRLVGKTTRYYSNKNDIRWPQFNVYSKDENVKATIEKIDPIDGLVAPSNPISFGETEIANYDAGLCQLHYVTTTVKCTISGDYKNYYVGDYTDRDISIDSDDFEGESNVSYNVSGFLAEAKSSSKHITMYPLAWSEVEMDPVVSLSVTDEEGEEINDVTIAPNASVTLCSTVLPATADQRVTWSTNNEGVATVEDGVIHAVANGEAVITATTNGKGTGGNALTKEIQVKVEGEAHLDPLPLTCAFNGSVPTGWTVAEEGYASYTPKFGSSGYLNVNYEKIYVDSPLFEKNTNGVSVVVDVKQYNKSGKKPSSNTDETIVFTVTGYNLEGELVATDTNTSAEMKTTGEKTFLLEADNINRVRVYATNLAEIDGCKANICVNSIKVTAIA